MGIQARYCGRKREDCKRAKGLQRRIRSQKYGWSRARTYGQAGAKNCREAASYMRVSINVIPAQAGIQSNIKHMDPRLRGGDRCFYKDRYFVSKLAVGAVGLETRRETHGSGQET